MAYQQNLLPQPLPEESLAYGSHHEQIRQLRLELAAAKANNVQLSETIKSLGTQLQVANSAIDNLPGMLAYWDTDLHCRFANQQYLSWFGRNQAQMLGIHMQDLMGPELFAKNLTYISAALGGEDQSFERILIKSDGQTSYTWARYLVHRVDGVVDGFFAIVLDISEIKRAQLIQTRFADIIASVNDAIISKDIEGKIDSWNPAAQRMFGYTQEQIIGHTATILIPQTRQIEDAAILARVKAGEYIDQWETRRLHLNGAELDVSINYSPMHNAAGQLSGVSAVMRDISEQKQFDRMKSEFVSTVSHELRTPLTSIRGALGLISGGALGAMPEKITPLISMAVNNCDRLAQLVNDILNVEKLAAGKFDFNLQRIDICALVSQTIVNDQIFAQRLGVEFQLSGQSNAQSGGQSSGPGAPIFVMADPKRIMQVLSNLLSNAAKFSRSGQTVDISVTLEEGRVRVAVRDHGIGIDDKFKARIFQKFAQADSSDSRKIQRGGTGLGLSIAKAIIEQHGGQIGYESEFGQGSCFYFILAALAEET